MCDKKDSCSCVELPIPSDFYGDTDVAKLTVRFDPISGSPLVSRLDVGSNENGVSALSALIVSLVTICEESGVDVESFVEIVGKISDTKIEQVLSKDDLH